MSFIFEPEYVCEGNERELGSGGRFDAYSHDHYELMGALGRLVLTSANAESQIRDSLASAYSLWDHAGFLFEGESINWLLEKARLLTNNPSFRYFHGKNSAVQKLCTDLTRLFGYRNKFVHSEYMFSTAGRYILLPSRRNSLQDAFFFKVEDMDAVSSAIADVSDNLVSIIDSEQWYINPEEGVPRDGA